jgi:hypothetical protein
LVIELSSYSETVTVSKKRHPLSPPKSSLENACESAVLNFFEGQNDQSLLDAYAFDSIPSLLRSLAFSMIELLWALKYQSITLPNSDITLQLHELIGKRANPDCLYWNRVMNL